MNKYIPLRVNSESLISNTGISIITDTTTTPQSNFKRGRGRPRKQSPEKNQHSNEVINNNNNSNSKISYYSSLPTEIIENNLKNKKNNFTHKNILNRDPTDETDSRPVIEIFEDYSSNKSKIINKNKELIIDSNFKTIADNYMQEVEVCKKFEISNIISDKQQKVFSYFATLNPQYLIKDEKFRNLKQAITNKYNEDRIINFLCMYLLYSEKELENSLGINNNKNQYVHNSSFDNLIIQNNQIIGSIVNKKENRFEKNLTIITKINDFNLIPTTPRCNSSPTDEVNKMNEKLSGESEIIQNKKIDSNLPVNIFNNFSQNGMADFPNNFQHPITFQLPKVPFNPNNTPFFYNPLYAANQMLYCIPPLIPQSHLINYTNSPLSEQCKNLTTNTENKLEINFGNKEKFSIIDDKKDDIINNREGFGKLTKKKNRNFLKKKRLRNVKNKIIIDNVDNGVENTDSSTAINTNLAVSNKNSNEIEIHIQSNAETYVQNTNISMDPFDEISKEMNKIERTPSFKANEEMSLMNEFSFRIDHFLDFNNETELYMHEDKITFDLDSDHNNNGVFNFNNSIEKGFKEKFSNNYGLPDINIGTNCEKTKEMKSNNQSTDFTNFNLTSTVENKTQAPKTQMDLNNTNNMNKSLLPSLLESNSKKHGESIINIKENEKLNNSNKSMKFSEKETQILKLIEEIHDKRKFDKLRTLIPEKSFKILEKILFVSNYEYINQNEISVNLSENLNLKIFPKSGKFSVVRFSSKVKTNENFK